MKFNLFRINLKNRQTIIFFNNTINNRISDINESSQINNDKMYHFCPLF